MWSEPVEIMGSTGVQKSGNHSGAWQYDKHNGRTGSAFLTMQVVIASIHDSHLALRITLISVVVSSLTDMLLSIRPMPSLEYPLSCATSIQMILTWRLLYGLLGYAKGRCRHAIVLYRAIEQRQTNWLILVFGNWNLWALFGHAQWLPQLSWPHSQVCQSLEHPSVSPAQIE